LEASLQSSGLSEREIEERLGWEAGLLGRILDGTAECGALQLLAIFAELGAERRGISSHSRWQERGSPMVRDLLERFHGLGYGKPAAASADVCPPVVMVEIERTVEEVLQRTFGKDLEKEKRARGGE
jgi:hypothetical protein